MAGVQVLGLCRWSYPSELKAFNTEFESEEALRAHLYGAGRMAVRLFYLEHVVLPCVAAQSDPEFTLVLMMGDQLPEPYRAQVLALIGGIPQIKPVFVPEGQNHRTICREVMMAERDPEARAVAEFRLDDDDAVAVDFVARTRAMFGAVRPAFRESKRAALDFCRGFVLATGAEGIEYRPVLAPYWTPALVIYVKPVNNGSLLDYPHMKVWKRMPTLTLQKDVMFLRGAHDDNDSAIALRAQGREDFPVDLTQMPGLLRDRFGIDIEAMENAWAALRRQ